MEKHIAVVLAAGAGKRMNSRIQKQYLLLEEKPVLYYSLKTFEESFIDEIILVVEDGWQEYCKTNIIEKYRFGKVSSIVAGGKERYHSVYCGLKAVKECDYVYIHDGARPFITQEILERARKQVKKSLACVVGMPVKDTIKMANSVGEVESTLPRKSLWQIQTPQVFAFPIIKEAYEKLMEKEAGAEKEFPEITDDAMVAETFLGQKVTLAEGSYENIKITTPEDLILGRAFLNKK